MVAPNISFWTGSDVTTTGAAFDITKLGQMATIYDYGTIDTGSSGSIAYFWVCNNATGSAGPFADAILSSSGQTYNGTDQLGLGEHASGSADHNTTGINQWDMQSGSLTGSVWIRSVYYQRSPIGFSGSVGLTSGSLASAFMNPMSGSAAAGSRRLSMTALVLSGSGGALPSGSGWLIGSYIQVLNGTPQGPRTGSFCLRYKYT